MILYINILYELLKQETLIKNFVIELPSKFLKLKGNTITHH